ncbi:MAG: amino acid permease [Candidatus Kapaibacterium sp.]|nr:MAG: amino acid permease [Candidatus Kapabacteria bacterium]
MHKRIFGLREAIALIIAAMVGTGVFTSLGLQLQSIPSTSAVLLLWVLGGIASLCGALAYAELGATLPRSGGEYHLLSKIYHPTLGFIAGLSTLVAGIAAPVAVAAVAFGKYASNVAANFTTLAPETLAVVLSVGVVVLVTVVHSSHIRLGALLHSGITFFNIALIVSFIIAALLWGKNTSVSLLPNAQDIDLMLSPSYAVSFVFVIYAYLGWNSSIYVLDEIKDPQKTLPRSVLSGVVLVMALYLLLNYAFLRTAPMQDFVGKIDVGNYAAMALFGTQGAVIMNALISCALLATVSSYTILAPRVWRAMGEDYPLFRFAAKLAPNGAPIQAFALQAAIAIFMVLTSTFETILLYAGFLLNLFNLLAVVGVIVLRIKMPDAPRPYKAWGYPITPLIFAAISLWMTAQVVVQRPTESAMIVCTFALGYALSVWNNRRSPQA